MRALRWALALALLTAAPVAGQTVNATPAELRAVRDSLVAVRTVVNRTADSVSALSTQGAGNTQKKQRQVAILRAQALKLGRQVTTLDVILARPPVTVPTPVPPIPVPPTDTTVVRCTVSPSSGPSVLIGGTQQFTATCVDSAGAVRKVTTSWRSGNPAVATVNAAGLATGVSVPAGDSVGFADIYASAQGVEGKSRLEVRRPSAPPTDPTEPGLCTLTLDGSMTGNVWVRAGQRACVGANLRITDGNLLVQGGILEMRPGDNITLLGADPNAYVGGGLQYSPEVDRDRGLWVWDSGQLDISCGVKLGWNRTGTDPTWLPGDEYWITPTDRNDYAPRRWTPGQPVPRIDPRAPAAEVINATRSCSITGPGHIHVHSTKSQRIEYVRLNQMGVTSPSTGEPVLGRYALHLHMMGEGSSGTIVRGVVAVDSRGKVFVPHASHGVTMIDNVSINSWENCMWWDGGDLTRRLLIDRMVCAGVKMPDALAGLGNTFNRAFFLGAGTDMEIRNSVATGVFDYNGYGVGFDWPDATGAMSTPGIFELLVWKFDTGNVAHNNRRGLRLWHVGTHAHVMDNVTSYRNAAGTENGSYLNANIYRNYRSIQDGYFFSTDFNPGSNSMVWAGNTWPSDLDGGPSRMQNCVLESVTGAPLRVSNRQLPNMNDMYALFEDCTFTAPAGQPKVIIGKPFMETCPWAGIFRRTNVLPEDILIEPNTDFHPCGGNERTHIVIEHADGRAWDVRFTSGQKVVTQR